MAPLKLNGFSTNDGNNISHPVYTKFIQYFIMRSDTDKSSGNIFEGETGNWNKLNKSSACEAPVT